MQGVWAYVQGGMGALSNAIAASAEDSGAEIIVQADVQEILLNRDGSVRGVHVTLEDGTDLEIESNFVLSNCTPYRTFTELLPKDKQEPLLGFEFLKRITTADYSCGAFKINCAVNEIPDFVCAPNKDKHTSQLHHRGTIHFETSMQDLEIAAAEVCTRYFIGPLLNVP